MASIRAKNGKLFFDLRVNGERTREYTALEDTPKNRRTMQKALNKIEAEITLGTFDYARYFPGSKHAKKFASASTATPVPPGKANTPLMRDFANVWFDDFKHSWRRSHAATVRSTLDCHIIPKLGHKPVGSITKADVLQFRSQLSKLPGRNGNKSLSAKTINRIVQILSQILDEAADRFEFVNPILRIKRLKQQKPDIHPFTLSESQQIIASIRPDYQNYMVVRFFTGLRTGEHNGLQWKYVDFDRRQILVRETLVRNNLEHTKTDGSQREIEMNQPVFDALQAQYKITGKTSKFVFCNSQGEPVELNNFTNRIWYPLLRQLNLDLRRPYQTRHTCATLWLGAGENPEWVARQLGHTDTTMLFKTYSRFVPNLTRRDGSAFDRFITGSLLGNEKSDSNCTESQTSTAPKEKKLTVNSPDKTQPWL